MNDNRLDLDSVTNIGSSEVKAEKANKEVKCLGKTFASDDERREYFREELRKKLPELKKMEGFPIGEDDDIVNLSDPPYYTACPNPWLNDFVAEWEEEKKNLEAQGKRKADFEVRTPYASDVSEGKNNPIYNAHSYHTKVPHPAIMRYILHYTQPGDILLDSFGGTGMTGVAAQMCGTPDGETKLKIEQEFKNDGLKKPIWGQRHALLGDLSPLASFISYNYNTPFDAKKFNSSIRTIISSVKKEYGWMYQTKHTDGSDAWINYVVWSDVFVCPDCGHEVVYWNAAYDEIHGMMKESFSCPTCGSLHKKNEYDKCWVTQYDDIIQQSCKTVKAVPVFLNYTTKDGKKHRKDASNADIDLINRIRNMAIQSFVPISKIEEGDKTGDPINKGVTHVHQFYERRSLFLISTIWNRLNSKQRIILSDILSRNATKMNRFIVNKYNPKGRINGPFTGTLYLPSEIVEQNVFNLIEEKENLYSTNVLNPVFVNSATHNNIADNTIDYIFTDPPFGKNYMYSELNFIQESWLAVKTNNKTEAIKNDTQQKGIIEYEQLMQKSFEEDYRVLKPGKWLTVEFSNTDSSVWNGIRIALQRAGFILANISVLNKKHGGIKSMSYDTSVKQDLVISCYKPSETFLQKFTIQDNQANTWSFIEEQLAHLPMPSYRDGVEFASIIERSPKVLYDRLITFFLMRGLPVPVDAADFQEGLRKRFIEEDGMIFTREQLNEYAALKQKHKLQPSQISMGLDLIVTESDAIAWLNHQLKKPQKYQDLQPDFRKANMASRKGENPIELMTVLEENFIKQDNDTWRIPDLNEAKDREILRNKALLKIWDTYCKDLDEGRVRKFKEVRLEALKAGFKKCFQDKDFARIKTMGDSIPENILTEDETLLNYYDIACTKV